HQGICDRRPVPSHSLSQLFLGIAKFIDEVSICSSLFNRVEIFALKVLDQRQLQNARIRHLFYYCGDFMESGELGCPPSTLTGDELKAIAAAPDDDGLNYAVSLERGSQLLKFFLSKNLAGLNFVGVDLLDADLDEILIYRTRLGEQGAKPFAKRLS